MNDEKPIIISLGGSLIVPNEIDSEFVSNFKRVIEVQIKKGKRFIIITGGGKTARKYIQAAEDVGGIDDEEKDWLGIHATRMNAHFIKTVFKCCAHPRINKNPCTKEDLVKEFISKEKIMVAAGWRPGWSTDYVATILAERFNSNQLINLSNIDCVYNNDPNKFNDAKKIKKISWNNFRKIVGDKWEPGLSAPFDPIASKLAQKNNLKVVIIGGDNLDNFEKYLQGKEFKGTTISS